VNREISFCTGQTRRTDAPRRHPPGFLRSPKSLFITEASARTAYNPSGMNTCIKSRRLRPVFAPRMPAKSSGMNTSKNSPVTHFRMNTYRQPRPVTTFRMNTYTKTGGRGVLACSLFRQHRSASPACALASPPCKQGKGNKKSYRRTSCGSAPPARNGPSAVLESPAEHFRRKREELVRITQESLPK
jgi:hypothetical protein